MNIKILDSWLREYLKTEATPEELAKSLSLTSAGIERVEKHGNDFLYDIEVTTNRPDLASVVGLAREAGAVLPQAGFTATFKPPVSSSAARHHEVDSPFGERSRGISHSVRNDKVKLEVKDPQHLTSRTLAVVLEVTQKKSPELIKNRLEASDIRSLNNLIDITNYTMRTIGFPTHVMDYDRIRRHILTIRESKPGETITTLDDKTYVLPGGDIVAEDGEGMIIDLLGIMGLENSVVTPETKRIVFFINADDPHRIRRTSMALGIRTEAAQMNEKGLDPELAYEALLFGIKQYEKLANGKVISDTIDLYPKKPEKQSVSVTEEHINSVIGVTIPLKKSAEILEKLGFKVTVVGDKIEAEVPSFRLEDVSIPEDLIEEIARVYGYQNVPDALPPLSSVSPTPIEDTFYWENRVKRALKYWGYTEVYTYPMVSEQMYEGELETAVKLKNPLGEEFAYMRLSLIPSLLQVAAENKKYETIKIFEIANVYEKDGKNLPKQIQHLAGVIKQKNASFFAVKGLIEQLAADLGIENLVFKPLSESGIETEILIGKTNIGTLEMLDDELIDFELDLEELVKHATTHKTFTPLQKYPPVIEDVSLIVDEAVSTGEIMETIRRVSPLIAEVSLLDKFEGSRTFHIVYRSDTKNLTTDEVGKIREKVLKTLKEKHQATLKT